MSAIVYARDGGVSVVYPTGDLPLEAVLAKDVPAGAEAVVMEAAALPDPAWRGAWRLAGGAVVIDMPAARAIYRDRIREARIPLLAALDVRAMRAIEAGASLAAIAAAKQALRDAPADPRIDAAETTEALAAAWPFP